MITEIPVNVAGTRSTVQMTHRLGSRNNLFYPHCRWFLYHLSHQGSPRILEWIAYPFSRGARGAGTLIPSAQRLVWAAKQALGKAALGALFA